MVSPMAVAAAVPVIIGGTAFYFGYQYGKPNAEQKQSEKMAAEAIKHDREMQNLKNKEDLAFAKTQTKRVVRREEQKQSDDKEAHKNMQQRIKQEAKRSKEILKFSQKHGLLAKDWKTYFFASSLSRIGWETNWTRLSEDLSRDGETVLTLGHSQPILRTRDVQHLQRVVEAQTRQGHADLEKTIEATIERLEDLNTFNVLQCRHIVCFHEFTRLEKTISDISIRKGTKLKQLKTILTDLVGRYATGDLLYRLRDVINAAIASEQRLLRVDTLQSNAGREDRNEGVDQAVIITLLVKIDYNTDLFSIGRMKGYTACYQVIPETVTDKAGAVMLGDAVLEPGVPQIMPAQLDPDVALQELKSAEEEQRMGLKKKHVSEAVRMCVVGNFPEDVPRVMKLCEEVLGAKELQSLIWNAAHDYERLCAPLMAAAHARLLLLYCLPENGDEVQARMVEWMRSDSDDDSVTSAS